jgi:tRNA threonylcarbamoyladenosine biosynthesis protein TsaE
MMARINGKKFVRHSSSRYQERKSLSTEWRFSSNVRELFAETAGFPYDESAMKNRAVQSFSTTENREETCGLGRALARKIDAGCIVALSGDLGSGKTTFAQGLLEGLGVPGPHTSPTFVIMKQYAVSSASHPRLKRVYHVDAYRVGVAEMLAVGWEEWLEDSEGIVLLEWPERIAAIVPKRAATVSFERLNASRRIVRITHKMSTK